MLNLHRFAPCRLFDAMMGLAALLGLLRLGRWKSNVRRWTFSSPLGHRDPSARRPVDSLVASLDFVHTAVHAERRSRAG